MSNPLTGDFEAAVEVRVEALNRILATLHQKGAFEGASPSFLHSFTARVGEIATQAKLELAEAFVLQNFGTSVGGDTKLPEDLLKSVQADLLSARRILLKASTGIGSAVESSAGTAVVQANFPELFVIRGTVEAQLSTLTVTFPEGTTSEAMIRCHVRAFYIPDPGTAALPETIHGEVLVGFVVTYHLAGPRLGVEVTSDDSKILFTPAAGTSLTAAEAKQIRREIRRFVRTKFKPMTVDLPSKQEFPFQRFMSLGTGSLQAMALPFNLTSTAKIPAFANFPPLFLKPGDDFAVAFSAAYIELVLKGPLDKLRQFEDGGIVTVGFPVPYPPFWQTVTWAYKVEVVHVHLEWHVGKVVLIVEGTFRTDPDEPSTSFTITQALKLELNPDQKIVLTKLGGLGITGLAPEIESEARPTIEKERDKALEGAQEAIDGLAGTINIDDALKPFDAQAKSTFSSLEIGPGGVVLHGTVKASARLPVMVVPVDVTLEGTALSALKSWVPGGTIDKFVWSWVSPDPTKPASLWHGIEHEVTKTHSFLFQPQLGSGSTGPEKTGPQAPPWETYQLCLRVEGTRVRSKPGPAENVSGGSTCQIQKPEWAGIVPPWWDAILLAPVWGPDPGPEAILENAIVAHVNVRSEIAPAPDVRSSALIHFSGVQSESSLSRLGEAVLRSKQRDGNLPIVLVLPNGSFSQTRALVDRKLGSFPRELRAPLIVTEDYEGNWTRAFDVTGGDATFLLSGEGKLVWSYKDRLDAASLAAALDQHVRARPRRLRSRPVGLAVRAGGPAPEVLLDDARGSGLAVTRLRGRRVLLMFWKSCSRPCLAELSRLQHISDRGGQRAPVIYAVGDGETPERIAEIAREHQLRFTLVSDSDRRIARRYGVNCWPTLVSINEEGLIDAVHAGVVHHRVASDAAGDRAAL
jgi:peroxiredoxin